jgi:glucose-1-phosphate adenylyltransferase
LGCLTKNLAKPAVPFGGKYRIIDFPLSNCSNSDIDTVGVLTQYQPLVLNSYIGIGSPWNLDRSNGGVTLLPPYVNVSGGEWYKGTANAIYQNIDFINQYDPEYVLVLSGDHIYKMDYSLMLDFHKEKQADSTIAVIQVPWEEASRFGIMNTDQNHKIVEFDEKPKYPKSNLASMGIYIFNWGILKKYLIEDEKNEKSSHDFGKNIIPQMLNTGLRIYAYGFNGYWKDVGTVESFYDANMDLLEEKPELDLYDSAWKIYSENSTLPPSYAGDSANICCSVVNEGCMILGEVYHSILFPGVYVGENARIKDSILMPGAIVENESVIEKTIVGEGAVIKSGAFVSPDMFREKSSEFTIDSNILLIPEKTVIK